LGPFGHIKSRSERAFRDSIDQVSTFPKGEMTVKQVELHQVAKSQETSIPDGGGVKKRKTSGKNKQPRILSNERALVRKTRAEKIKEREGGENYLRTSIQEGGPRARWESGLLVITEQGLNKGEVSY